jgi:hypothetical protein
VPRPFDTGSQCGDWFEVNCYGCKKIDLAAWDNGDWGKVSSCEIDAELQDAFQERGEVSDDIARRMGWQDTDPPRYTWRCPEREASR